MTDPAFHTMPDGRRIAFRHVAGSEPAIVFLPGYLSDMAGAKAAAVLAAARRAGRECLLIDYSGCGASGGSFAEGTLSAWREEVLALIHAVLSSRQIILVGSSMGGWLMLLAGLVLRQGANGRLAGLVGIAAAPDFTEWGVGEAAKAQLRAGETVHQANPYGPEPTPIHPRFWADAQHLRVLDEGIALACPVRLLHGQDDGEVPTQISLRLAEALHSADVQVTLVKGGDHRLSRPGDLTLLIHTIEALAATVGTAR